MLGTITKSKTNDLILPLKKQWFYMIASGEKPEEYREITEYWIRRFLDKECWIELPTPQEIIDGVLDQCDFEPFRKFDAIEFTCGYPKKEDTSRRMTFQNPHIRIGEGKTEWGAEKGKKYFVISWDKF